MFYTINSSPNARYQISFEVNLQLPNYQTCTFPLKENPAMGYYPFFKDKNPHDSSLTETQTICVSNSEFGNSISFWVESNSFSTLFNLAYRHSFSWHIRPKKRLRIWMLLWWMVKLNDYFVKLNDATLHLTNHKTKSNDPFQ